MPRSRSRCGRPCSSPLDQSDPKDIAARVVDAIAAGVEEVHADDVAAAVKGALSNDLEHLCPGVQQHDAAVA